MRRRPLINQIKWWLTCASATLGSALLISSVSYAHDLAWPGEKLRALSPEAVSFEQKNLYVSDAQRAEIERTLGTKLPDEDLRPSIYLAVVKDRPEGRTRKAAAIIFIDTYGEGGKIEMGVVVGVKGELLKIQLFDNKEPQKISRPDFLRQFEGKKASDHFKVGIDMNAPHGLEKSAQAVASGARRGLLIINEVFRKK